MIIADLHVHTNISDGSLTTQEAIKLAKKNKVTHIAITNHDTVKGLAEAIKIGKEEGVHVIPGIEISAYDYKRKRKVHLLGYGFDLEGSNLKKLCSKLLNDRNNLSIKQAKLIKEMGYDIELEDIKKYSINSEIVYKQHIMQELINKGYCDKIYAPLYKKLFRGDSPCNLEVEYIDILEAMDAIIKDGGMPVLAHPGQLNSYELLEELVEKGLVGVEKYHVSHSEEDYKIIDELSQKHNLIITGGSDFHGTFGKEVTIGSFTTPLNSLKHIIQHIDNNN